MQDIPHLNNDTATLLHHSNVTEYPQSLFATLCSCKFNISCQILKTSAQHRKGTMKWYGLFLQINKQTSKLKCYSTWFDVHQSITVTITALKNLVKPIEKTWIEFKFCISHKSHILCLFLLYPKHLCPILILSSSDERKKACQLLQHLQWRKELHIDPYKSFDLKLYQNVSSF